MLSVEDEAESRVEMESRRERRGRERRVNERRVGRPRYGLSTGSVRLYEDTS